MRDRAASREPRLAQAFVALADSLAGNFEVTRLLDTLAGTCSDLFHLQLVEVLLTDPDRRLRRVAPLGGTTTSPLDLDGLRAPIQECLTTGSRVGFGQPAAAAAGIGTTHLLPLRLRDERLGVMALCCADGVALTEPELDVAQAMADVATIALISHRAIEAGLRLAGELQQALDTRVAIEQATGMLAQYAGVQTGPAFEIMRLFARSTNARLAEVADAVASGRLHPRRIVAARTGSRRRR